MTHDRGTWWTSGRAGPAADWAARSSAVTVSEERRLGPAPSGPDARPSCGSRSRRTWSESASSWSAAPGRLGIAFVAVTLVAGVFLAVTFVGLLIIAASLRGARGIGGSTGPWPTLPRRAHRGPEPFAPRPASSAGSRRRCGTRTGWRALGLRVRQGSRCALRRLVALQRVVDAFFCLTYPCGHGGDQPGFGLAAASSSRRLPLGRPATGSSTGSFIFVTGVVLFFVAPWADAGRRLPRPRAHAPPARAPTP